MLPTPSCNASANWGCREFRKPELGDFLAKLGSDGEYLGNNKTELVAAPGDPEVLEPSYVQTPMRISKPGLGKDPIKEVDLAVFLPHGVMAYLYQSHRSEFEDLHYNTPLRGLAILYEVNH